MEDILRGIFGITVLLGVLYLFSSNRKAIDWKLVGMALFMQILFGLAVLKIDVVSGAFDMVGRFFIAVLDFTKEGATFVFGGVMDTSNVGYIFAFQILPTIVFFSALTSILYYLGILQRIIYVLAYVMSRVMRLSGAESLAAAANVFIGQTEAPLIIKPYLHRMTKSELLCLMCGGMATIAGGVLAAFIGFLGGEDPVARQEFARHLLTASIMSAPAAILAAKMLYPETEEVDKNLDVPKETIGSNLLEAISIGTADGLKLAVNVGAMLIVFIGLVAMLNAMCSSTLGEWIGWTTDGSWAFFQSTFAASSDTFIRTTAMPIPVEETIKVIQDTVIASSTGADSIARNIIEQPITVMQDSMVYDTLSRSKMDVVQWAVIAQDTIQHNGMDSIVAVDGWVLYENEVAMDTLAYASSDLNRISLNMYINQVTEGRFDGFNLEYLLGLLMSPVAWILGTPSEDVLIMGQLLGKKTILNEFVAYADIPTVSAYIQPKTKILATYALCGFANFASIGIQIGGIGALAPERRATLAQFGIKSLIGGTIACFLTATIAGMLVG